MTCFVTLLVLIVVCTTLFDASNAIAANNLTKEASPKFPAILIFGDSTVDTGNNNYITSLMKANHLPYGVDFPNRVPTGRFSNGKLLPDLIASSLGIKETVPPFLDPTLSDGDIVTGVCFASAGSGYDELTNVASLVIPVEEQKNMFSEYISRLESIAGKENATKIVNEALVVISTSTNDWGFNFYNAIKSRASLGVSGYQDFLLNKAQIFFKGLYDLGARNFFIAGLPPVGCLPIEKTAKLLFPFPKECLANENANAVSYNAKLVKLLPKLQAALPGTKMVYADVYTRLLDMVTKPKNYDFVEARKGCCGTGILELSIMLTPSASVCEDSSKYVFFDSIHPTQAAYEFIAQDLEKTILEKF